MTTPRAVLADDTAAWAEAMQVEHWRRIGPSGRLGMLAFLRRGAARMQRAVAATPTNAPHLPRQLMAPIDGDAFAITALAGSALEASGVRYAVVGSLASIAFGEPRLTADADLIAELRPKQVRDVVARWTPDFFVDDEAVAAAARRNDRFNIVHRASSMMVDIYVRGQTPWDRIQFERRRRVSDGDASAFVITPEDIILSKLRRYRMGNEVSERQWRDVLGVLLVQAGTLDDAHLDRWAAELGVDDLLAKARAAVLRGDDAMSGVG